MKKKRSLSALKKALDVVFSKFIRARDAKDGFFTCISCGKTQPVSQMQCGHFYARTFLATRWHEKNSNGQDIRCNMWLSGNLLNYRKGMLAKYGESVLQELEELHNKSVKLDRAYLEDMIEKYKNKTI